MKEDWNGYSTELVNLIEDVQRHGLSHHSYADDTQLYMTMDHYNN